MSQNLVTKERRCELDAATEEWLRDARVREHPTDACRALWAAVLADGLGLALGQATVHSTSHGENRTKIDRRLAWEWLRSQDEGVGTFRWVCALIDVDPEVVLERVFDRDDAKRIRSRLQGMARTAGNLRRQDRDLESEAA